MQRLITIPVKQYEKMLQTYDDVVKELMALREKLEEYKKQISQNNQNVLRGVLFIHIFQ